MADPYAAKKRRIAKTNKAEQESREILQNAHIDVDANKNDSDINISDLDVSDADLREMKEEKLE